MNAMEANSLVRGMVFVVQKTRADIMESMGSDEAAQSVLAMTSPDLFGERSILPRLVEWQDRCKKSGIISGSDMFNLFKYMEMKMNPALGLLGVYGYTSPETADISWFTQTWPYLTDGVS